MKKTIYSLVLSSFLFGSSCTSPQVKNQEIQLTNNSKIKLVDKPISIKRTQLTVIDSTAIHPIVISGTDTIASQVNASDNDTAWDELFFVMDFAPEETKTITIAWSKQLPKYPQRTSARFGKRASKDAPVKPKTHETMLANELPLSIGYQQYQTDGPSWENDKVGFRHYLDGRNAKDLFGKKTTAISPENVGISADGAVEDNYHTMEDWGRDILAVGNSLGLGGFGLIKDSTLMRLGVTVNDTVNNVEETKFKILHEGPVNTTLQYKYTNWNTANGIYDVKETTSIWLGMYGYQNTVTINGLTGDENLVVGLVNIHNDMPLEVLKNNNKYVILLTHDKQSYDKEWWLGMAIILPKEKYLGYMEAPKTGNLSNSYLAILDIKDNEPVKYFAIAGWELSDEKFVDRNEFINYVLDMTDQLSVNIKITL
ncbi:DUF4861 domain-containing protein [Maribacter sp. MAR_2009_72]|uniref:DUF4861 domain-containing protein n=1 Tax=Maribacter sp. MAR_2009_72 TaxID=1250050 RepID=UPI001198CCAF|nr:DUF4861 domain-containing protein [Maribacter sp. MAR_2009_72]TVZ16562.1 uncharacterized protein DUF4861 [Maribacter sp. MAR_2009_72]